MTDLVQITAPSATHEEFLEARRIGLGSSDIAALLGVDKYRTALGVYLDKKFGGDHTEVPEEESEEFADPDSNPAYWGTLLEAPVAEHFARRAGVAIIPAGTYARDWMLASPDRLLLASPEPGDSIVVPHVSPAGEEGTVDVVAGYEGKTASAYLSDEWESGKVPDRYLIQVYWQCHVLGLPYVWIAALIGGQRYRQVRVDADPVFQSDLEKVAREFWFDRILADRPPSLVGEPVAAALDLLAELHPVSIEGSTVEVGPEFEEWVRRRQWHKAMAKAHADAAGGYEVAIREAMGDVEVAYVADDTVRSGRRQVAKLTNIAGGQVATSYYREPRRGFYPGRSYKIDVGSVPELDAPSRKELP